MVHGRASSFPTPVFKSGAPVFRGYLGEWRRLADQGANLTTLAPTAVSAGGATRVLVRSEPVSAATKLGVKTTKQAGLGSTQAGQAKAYGLYLSNP